MVPTHRISIRVFPALVAIAAHISSVTAAGSSTTRSRTPRNPYSVRAFAPCTVTRVRVVSCSALML